jgi:DNA-binding SARP family transcriptional activator
MSEQARTPGSQRGRGRHPALSVQLLGQFHVQENGRTIDLPNDAQRLVAFLALQGHGVPRTFVAGVLWIDSDQERAFGNLRSALWRLRQKSRSLVASHGNTLGLSSDVDVDVERASRTANKLFSDPDKAQEQDYAIDPFVQELLPGWYDDWALIEREQVRQQALHALEAIANRLTRIGRHPEAITAALAAIRLDPYRESAHRCLIRIHLSEGNPCEAIRQYDFYKTLLRENLGLAPSSEMFDLISAVEKGALAKAH